MYLPDDALNIISLLESEGFLAYVVGGCVRDSLMDRPYGDIDICTDAFPERVADIFSSRGCRVHPTGVKHGTVTVMTDKACYEVTTFRTEGRYSDARHPDSVRFVGDIAEDLARRDFTVNAMAYSPDRGLVDPFGGRKDIEKRLIRAVGDPKKRFSEDALRILRAVRFSARLGFEIEPETREAIAALSDGLRHISAERIAIELCGILLSERPEAVMELHSLGVIKYVIPELEPMFESGLEGKAIKAVSLLPPKLEQRLAVLFIGDGALAERALRRLKLSSSTISRTCELVSLAKISLEPDKPAVKRFLKALKRVGFIDYEEMGNALLLAKEDFGGVKVLKMCRVAYDIIIDKNEPYLISHLAIDGKDLEAIGHKGRHVGRLLEACVEYVIDNPDKNSFEALLKYVLSLPHTIVL